MGVRQLVVANGPNIFQMLLVILVGSVKFGFFFSNNLVFTPEIRRHLVMVVAAGRL